MTPNVFFPFITSFLLTVAITPIALIFIRKLGLFDNPQTHKHPAIIHNKPIPRAGGLPLFIGITLTSLVFIPLTPMIGALFFAGFLALIIGLLDDKFDISPYVRFAVNILCALIVVGNGVTIPFITNPLGGILFFDALQFPVGIIGVSFGLGDIIAIIWIVWVMNMLNWSKGVDGQMPGIVAISAIVIGILSLRFASADENTITAATLSFIIAGASLGFLLFNFYPAKIFPGYSATAVYLFLSVVSILSGSKLATAILVMGVPMIDGAITIIRRLATGHSPFRHDNKHLHHLLLKLGFGQRRIALFYWFVSAILGMISLTLESRGKLFAIVMIVIVIGGAILFLHIMLQTQHEDVSKKDI